jgi:hypothetical protein
METEMIRYRMKLDINHLTSREISVISFMYREFSIVGIIKDESKDGSLKDRGY